MTDEHREADVRTGSARRPGVEDAEARIGLVVDSTSMLAARESELSDALSGLFAIVPLAVTVGEDSYVDGELGPDELCERMRAGERAATSMPAAESFSSAYARLEQGGATDILVLPLSAQLSGTADAASTAAEAVSARVRVFDTRTVSAGLAGAADIVVAGVRAGIGPAALTASVEDYLAEETRTLFCPESLDYLAAGGRIGRAASLLGRALSIVPILGLVDGEVHVIGRVRTSSKAASRLAGAAVDAAAAMAASHPGRRCELVLLAAEGSLDAAGDFGAAVWSHLQGADLPEGCELSSDGLSTVITAHAGPGAVGIAVRMRP